MHCLFCKMIAGEESYHKIWEDEAHLAFLSVFPNTDGFSVVITKDHYSSYAFDQDDSVLCKLILASKHVGKLLDRALEGVGRTGLIFEGYGVDHLHSKLIPMHGTGNTSTFKSIHSTQNKFFHCYEGYLSSHDHERANNKALAQLAKHIRRFT
ncbi:HIT family protein [Zooshikella harenae]|uniref:HIT family protein n=1 Tax=Zooshikella harenae TaxID=2827238 RepID=A0ABS5ZDP5_9GAMM|nr:HIT family protein [Zooshikella harenae]MBU2711436.1 HIT family protein [Zooshikella harenae]